MFAKLIATIDKFLYKKIGIITPLRRAYWRRNSKRIQTQLDIEHNHRDYINRKYGTNFTTLNALKYDTL